MPLRIKICGLTTQHTLAAALEAGADMIGLVFHPKSPRYIELEPAADLADEARGRATVTALVADADDGTLAAIQATVEPDLWQLHGRESPARVAEIKQRFGLPAMKAIGIAGPGDLAGTKSFIGIADHVLLDAKPPEDAAYPGGHGRPFDWAMLSALDPALPFMLSGGLTPETVAEAILAVRALKRNLAGVDVSSGVERAPGQKSVEKIRDFIAAVRKVDK